MAIDTMNRPMYCLPAEPIKEMFINEITKPDENHPDYRYIEQDKKFNKERYETNLKAWQKAEKKVIFEDLNYIEELEHVELYYKHKFIMQFYLKDIKSLKIEDLFRLTNGELKLKNVTL